MAPSRKSINQATVTFADSKEKRKIIESAKTVDCQPNLSDVHISNTEDSYSNTVLPLGMQIAKYEPPLNGDQLLQMLSIMQKQTEMIRLLEVDAREKEAATCIQT